MIRLVIRAIESLWESFEYVSPGLGSPYGVDGGRFLQRGQPPERFAGLHVVVRALIDHLRDVYDVDVDEDPVNAGEMLSDEANPAPSPPPAFKTPGSGCGK